MFDLNYHTSHAHLHVNCEKPRAYFIPYENEKAALADRRAQSKFLVSLCGEWDFRFYSLPSQIEDFTAEGFSTDGFDKIDVPRSWQTVLGKGYDVPQYTNHEYPFPFDPPHVPADNPCGLYSRDVYLGKEFLSKRIYINFEGVDSCFYLYVNGHFAGYSQVSHCTSEIEITSLLTEGKNNFRVLVFKWCDGSYLEDQDKYRLSGIFREVYLLARDEAHLRDVYLHPSLSEGYGSAVLGIETEATGEAEYSYRLLSPTGDEVASGKARAGEPARLSVDAPMLWCDEIPNLYKLVLHCGSEYICFDVGFKDVKIVNRIIYINGKKVKARGINRHDSHPILGAAVPEDHMLRDLYIMKQHNINTVRTSHYPNDPRFVGMCARLGFYVVDEADIETHGALDVKYWDYITDSDDWTESFLDRCERMFERDKNCPAIIMWSVGNEMGVGKNQAHAYDFFHKRMPECIVHCEDFSRRHAMHFLGKGRMTSSRDVWHEQKCCDVMSYMYWSPEECVDLYLKSKKVDMPLFLCEYAHSMGVGPGDLKAYWDVIYANDRFFGGCVWEYCDHSIATGDVYTDPKYTYGGDFREFPSSGNFCVDGMVYPDRRPHTGLKEYKQILKPFAITEADLESASFRIKNMRFFTGLEEYSLYWSFEQNGRTVKQGFIPSLAVKPQTSKKIFIDLSGVDKTLGGELNVSLRRNTATEWAEVAFEVGFEQISFAPVAAEKQGIMESMSADAQVSVDDSGATVRVCAGETVYTFDKQSGLVCSVVDNGKEMLASPMSPKIWRAPTDNDRRIVVDWRKAGYDNAWLDCRGFSVERADGKAVVLSADMVMSRACNRPFLRMNVTYTVLAEGGMVVDTHAEKCDITYEKASPEFPRFGFEFKMPDGSEKVAYYGRGAGESYEDMRHSSRLGVFETTATDNFEHYIRPQENSAHVDTRWVSVSGVTGHGLLVLSVDKPFSFNCCHYTAEQLTETAHDYELLPLKATVVNIDYRNAGIGSHSCGPRLNERYRIDDATIDFSFRVLPCMLQNVTPEEEFGRGV